MAETRRSWNFVIAFILIFLLIIFGSVWFTNLRADTQSYTYNGFVFTQAQSGSDVIWVTQIQVRGQLYNIPFYYHPTEVEDVFFSEGLAERIVDNPQQPNIVYFSFDPDAGSLPVIAGVELSRIFGTKYDLLNLNVKSALSRPDSEAQADIIVKTCADAAPGVLVIEFSLGIQNSVTNTGNCVHVQYTSAEESIRVADRFAYELLKIM